MATAPLLGIPGTLCDGRMYDTLAERLGRPVACSGPVRHPTVAAAAEEILATAPARFVPIGFSLGGFVVLELLRSAPGRLAGAVLISSSARADAPAHADRRREQVASVRARGPKFLIDAMWPDYVAPAASGRADLRALLTAMAEGTSPETFAAQAELAISRPDSRPSLATIDVPMLVLGGHHDRLCPADRQKEIAAFAARATLAMVDTGHFAPVEDPAGVADAIASWSAGA